MGGWLVICKKEEEFKMKYIFLLMSSLIINCGIACDVADVARFANDFAKYYKAGELEKLD